MTRVNMLMFVLCCMMKIIEMSGGGGGQKEEVKPRKRYRRRPPRRRTHQRGKVMNDADCVVRGAIQDLNSNMRGAVAGAGAASSNATAPDTAMSCLSNASSHASADFIQDNSDYQWFLDYGYREGGIHHHTSILSSLSESYGGPEDVGYYEALSKNLDANLAEADMESFRTEDIHALLTTLPAMCTDMQLAPDGNHQGEMFASVTGSMMEKFEFDSSISPHSSSQGEESANSPDTMSICKSELLFSPVKETPMPGANFSIDSLDCELLNGEDIMLTCQANKDNYTIAFEGSMTMYSEESYHQNEKNNFKNMARSDSGLTTWSKLKKTTENKLRKYPSGNNNNSASSTEETNDNSSTLKSVSMPDLNKKISSCRRRQDYINKSPLSNSSCESCSTTSKKSLVKVFNIQHQSSDMAISVDSKTQAHHNFNLVKLFMKQKSISADGMSLDQSSASEKWGSQSESSGESKKSNFDDSLVVVEPKLRGLRKYDQIDEEVSERSESVEELSESYDSKENAYGNGNGNVNNNNSMEKLQIRKGTQTRHLSQNISSEATTSTESLQKRNCNVKSKLQRGNVPVTVPVPVNLMSRSIQTSIYPLKEQIKIIEPSSSFLTKLKKESDSLNMRPIYIVYPSYTLPDLEFLNTKDDITKVLLAPQNEIKKPESNRSKGLKNRPFSCNDMETLKKKGFGHIRDWDSLTFLLPQECRQVLSDIPEYMNTIREQENRNREKLVRDRKETLLRKRPMSCNYDYSSFSSNSSTTTQPSSGYRGSSTILTDSSQSPAPTTTTTTTNFNPLFVYRYDSVTSSEASLNEKTVKVPPLPKRSISLPQGQEKEIVPPRPPLPKSILRNTPQEISSKVRKNLVNKRYSMFEMNMGDYDDSDDYSQDRTKRKSLHEPYFNQNQIQKQSRRTFSEHSTETEDEGVEMHGTTDSSLDERFENLKIRPPTPPLPKKETLTNDELDQLEQLDQYLKTSGISCLDTLEWDENNLLKLRSHVSKFLSLKINKDQFDFGGKKCVSFNVSNDLNPPNSPNVSAIRYTKTLADIAPICEEGENASPTANNLTIKQNLVSAVTQAVEQLIHHFSIANDQGELNTLGDAELNPTCAKMVLSNLCPALYALLSDGLKSSIETSFGAINNSVWQVVEASSQQGPLTKALNELVMKINSEDVISNEGILKFNAFVIGLLNVRSLDAWASYLRTRETVLRKHYNSDSLMLLAQTGGPNVRNLLDTLIATLQPLALLPFQIDLLFEYRQLHMSLKRMDSYHQPTSSPTHGRFSPMSNHLTNKQLTLMKLVRSIQSSMSCDESEDISIATMIKRYSPIDSNDSELLNTSSSYTKPQVREEKQRPRSCIDPNLIQTQDLASTVKKRWSGIHMGSKFVQAFDRLATDTEEEYSDSLEHNVNRKSDSDTSCGSNKVFNYVPQLPHEDGPASIDSQKSEDTTPLNGNKFRRLQMKWEMLSGKDVTNQTSPPLSPTHTPKSKIPRPIQSPVRASGIPVPVSSVISPKTANQKPPIKKVTTPPGGTIKKSITPNRSTTSNCNTQKKNNITRTSRVDQLENGERPHLTRPSSLPYRPVSATQGAKGSKLTPPRRAVSSSVTRKVQQTKAPKVVKTLTHRLPSDNGHLSFNEGEKLKVILEVDSKWLLCCRGDQKGLVPKSAVINIDTGPRS